jgi:hypothetical protein
MTEPAADPALPEYPGHSGSFGNLMRSSGLGQAQNVVRAKELDLGLLSKVRDDELPLLFNIGIAHHAVDDVDVSRRTVAVEVNRRSLAATKENIAALARLNASVTALIATTDAASTNTAAALDRLNGSLETLRVATDSWSRWLTRLTIGVAIFTAALLVVAIVQVTR